MRLGSIICSLILLIAAFSFPQQNIWEPVGDPLEGNTFTVLAIDSDDNLYSGTYFNFFKSTNNGDEWISIYNGIYNGYSVTSIVFNSQGEMFVGTREINGSGGGIFKSVNKGETWVHLDDSLISFPITDLDINSNDHFFAAIHGHGVYRSTDNGISWEEKKNGFNGFNGFNYLSVQELYIPKSGPLKDYLFVSVFALGEYSYIYRSTDNGENWQQMNFSDPWFFSVAFISTSDGVIYDGLANTAPHSYYGSILKSTDYGFNWTWAGSSANTTEFILDHNEYIYAGTIGNWWGWCQGIIRTTDGGNNWDPFNAGLLSSCGSVLACNSEGILFAGTGTGIYRTIESTTDVYGNEAVIHTGFELFQNYPNPFNPSTNINYHLTQSEKATLKVYDILGKQIAVLVNEEQPAGSYDITFDASELRSGVYFYALNAGIFRGTKKMILVK